MNHTRALQAYRKLALEWHPDKFEGEDQKKVAEAKFMDIAAAKEVWFPSIMASDVIAAGLVTV